MQNSKIGMFTDMTIFRYKKNGLLYTITVNRHGRGYKVHPYKHHVEIGVQFNSHGRFRDFKVGMNFEDFVPVSEC